MGKVRRIARQEGVPLPLLRGLIRQESRNDPNARSPAGAVGRTQLMPATARSLGVDPYNDTENVRGGARYLRQQLDRFGGDRRKALAAYNAGPGAVEKYGGVPPFPETQNYVRNILRSAGAAAGGATGRASQAPGAYQPGRVDLRRVMGFDKAGFEQATQRAKVGEFLASRGRGGGLLFRSGLLSTTAPDRADFTTSRLRSTMIAGHAAAAQDSAPASGQVQRALQEAHKRLGVREVNGTNRGARLDKWERRFGTIGAPWCGIYTGVVLQKAGVKGVTSRIASVDAIEQDARAGTGPFRAWHSAANARAGDLLVTAKGQHVVFVTGRDKQGRIKAIGGNTGNGAVERRTYDPSQVYGVARPRYRG